MEPMPNLTKINLEIMVGGRSVGHLDFLKINDPSVMRQMLINAIVEMKQHAERGFRNQAKVYAERLAVGFKHARTLGDSYKLADLDRIFLQYTHVKEYYHL